MKKLPFGRLDPNPVRRPAPAPTVPSNFLEPPPKAIFDYAIVQHAMQRVRDNSSDQNRASLMDILGV
jgi:hypothetical protein